ncbi:hypothetical protein ACOXBD_000165 [Escherichia coli]
MAISYVDINKLDLSEYDKTILKNGVSRMKDCMSQFKVLGATMGKAEKENYDPEWCKVAFVTMKSITEFDFGNEDYSIPWFYHELIDILETVLDEKQTLRVLLKGVKEGKISIDKAIEIVNTMEELEMNFLKEQEEERQQQLLEKMKDEFEKERRISKNTRNYKKPGRKQQTSQGPNKIK